MVALATLLAGAFYFGKSSTQVASISAVSQYPTGASIPPSNAPDARPPHKKPPVAVQPTQTGSMSIREMKLGSLPPLDKPLASQISDLKDRADHGDTDAAVKLWSALQQCDQVLKASSDIDNVKSIPGLGRARLEQQANTLEACAGVTQAQITERYRLLANAAAAGNPQAQYHYAMAGPDAVGGVSEALRNPDEWREYHEEARSYLESLAQQCSPDAITGLMNSYSNGDWLVARDPAQATLFFLVGAKVNNADRQDWINQHIGPYSRGLTQDQLNYAGEQAAKFYSQNCH